MAGLTWLHLSDWHQKGKEFDRKVVRDKLIKDITDRKKISQDLAEINFIVFSGDVAFSGQPEEYQAAKKELFEPILKACGLGPEKLFIVPGNHDIDRTKFELLPEQLLKPLDSDIQAKEWLFDREKRRVALGPFKTFASFVSRYTHQKNTSYANICQYEIGGKKISLLGLNSAWMCGRRKDSKEEIDDKGVVVVGEPQIHDILDKVAESDIKIAVLHHPFSWLADFECSQIERSLMEGCNFILRGHQHEPQVSFIHGTNGECVTIPAGACYDHRIYANAYNFVHLDLENGKGVVFLRCWNGKDKWREDVDSSPGGKFAFNIYESVPQNHQLGDGSEECAKSTPIDSGPEKAIPSLIPHQIPSPQADFKGREEEINDILSSFDKGATIIGLRGMAGVGKTALAFALGERLKDSFPDGQLFVSMLGTSPKPLTPQEAMAQVIRSYQPTLRLPESEAELANLYRSLLNGKRALLLLDNALDDRQVRPLLPPAECCLIVTSRRKFKLSGMIVKDLEVLKLNEAVELLHLTAGTDLASGSSTESRGMARSGPPVRLPAGGIESCGQLFG